jgi:hypothetical protein
MKISLLLKTLPSSSPVIASSLHLLNTLRPILRYRITPEEVWGSAVLRETMHVDSTFSDTVSNVVRATGRPLTASDEEVLQRLLTHPGCWSTTPTTHMNDGWVRYIRAYPKNPIPGLTPILDSLAFPEDLRKYPPGYLPQEPSFFLFGTPKQFYVYCFIGDTLCRAGATLAEVLDGMRKSRHDRGLGDAWEEEEISDQVDQLNNESYFPEYTENYKGEVYLIRKIKEFP